MIVRPINLLPPDIKTAMRFGRYNVRVINYGSVIVGTVLILVAAFGATLYYLDQQSRQLTISLADQKSQITAYAPFQTEAKAASDRLGAIKAITTSQTRFSVLLADLARVIPQGVSLDSITLTGDDKKPIRLTATATTYETALAFRDAIITSPRIAGADLETVAKSPDKGTFAASISIAFKPGQAK